MVAYIDRIFREYGENFFGKKAMDQITDAQVEEARCAACQELYELTAKYGLQSNDTCKELFCNYVFSKFI